MRQGKLAIMRDDSPHLAPARHRFHAVRRGEASLIAPLEYSALVWGVCLDLALWHVLPDGVTWLGAGIIVVSGLYLLRREKVHAETEHP